MYDIGLTLHDIVLDSLEPIVVKNLLNSLAIILLSVTVLPLMQKLILRDVCVGDVMDVVFYVCIVRRGAVGARVWGV